MVTGVVIAGVVAAGLGDDWTPRKTLNCTLMESRRAFGGGGCMVRLMPLRR